MNWFSFLTFFGLFIGEIGNKFFFVAFLIRRIIWIDVVFLLILGMDWILLRLNLSVEISSWIRKIVNYVTQDFAFVRKFYLNFIDFSKVVLRDVRNFNFSYFFHLILTLDYLNQALLRTPFNFLPKSLHKFLTKHIRKLKTKTSFPFNHQNLIIEIISQICNNPTLSSFYSHISLFLYWHHSIVMIIIINLFIQYKNAK